MYLYDVGEVSAHHHERPGRPSPCRKITPLSNGQISDLVFVDKGKRLVLACNDVLCCWSTVGPEPSLVWKFQWKAVSSIVSLCNDMVVLGSKQGHLALLNWEKTHRTSFSLKPIPTIVDEWVSYRGLEVPNSAAMGIQHLRVERLINCPASTGNWGHCNLIWMTACGWLLSTTLQSLTTRTSRSQIIYATNPMQCLNSKGEVVQESKRSWSYNGGVTVVDSTQTVFCWIKAEDVTKHIPHHDKYVLDSQPRFVTQSGIKPTLTWKRAIDGRLQSIPLSKRKGSPTAIAVHPSHEWIVVGSAKGLYAINGRCKI